MFLNLELSSFSDINEALSRIKRLCTMVLYIEVTAMCLASRNHTAKLKKNFDKSLFQMIPSHTCQQPYTTLLVS